MTLTATEPVGLCVADPVEVGLERRLDESVVESLADAELLRRFMLRRDEAAFAQMVRRHGPMVLRTCQRIVGHACDAEDAFQAVFMVLVRKAHCVQPASMLGPWLHGVACRCGLAQKHKLLRQRQREHVLEEVVLVNPPAVEAMDWLHYLDQEIQRLPAIYRQPVVLCELEGRGRKETAALLGVAEGTLSSRLAGARKRLAKRLKVRGLVGITAFSSWVAMNNTSYAALPEKLVASTTQLGMNQVVQPAAAALSPAVAQITQGALESMFFTKCKTLALIAIGFGCLSYGCWFIGDVGAAEPEARKSLLSESKGTPEPDPQDKSSRRSKPTGDTQETIVGSGKIVTATRQVSDFKAIQLLNAGKLTIKQTGKEKLTLRTDDNILPHLSADVEDNMLVLKNAKNVNLKPSKDNEYTIEVKQLSRLDIKGAGTITVQGLEGKDFELLVQGAGTVTLEGHAGTLVVNLQGAGTVDAEKLGVDRAKVTIPGSGSVIINAKESLSASIDGAGSVKYSGSPEVTKSIRGVGSVTRQSGETKKPVKP